MPDIRLSSLSMVSATEGWAVGSTVLPNTRQRLADGSTRVRLVHGRTFGVLLHYHAGQWDATYAERSGLVSSVSMTSAQDGWMVGGSTVFRYSGSTWVPVTDPVLAQVRPRHVVAASPVDVWVVGTGLLLPGSSSGFNEDVTEVILHYNGREWDEQQTDLANSRIFDLAPISATEGWAAGRLSGGMGMHPARPEQALIESYIQGRWQRAAHFASPTGNREYSLYGLALVSASEGWAVGSDGLIVQGHHGVWTQVASPTDHTLWSVGIVSPTEGWAVGEQETILHYHRGGWSLYPGV